MAAAAESFPENDQRPLRLYFQDEARFGRMHDHVSCWAPEGYRPIIKMKSPKTRPWVREYTHVYSAVSPLDGDSFSLILPYANTEMMTIFLREFSEYRKDYRVVMVMDGAVWHKAKALGSFKNIRILYQPPYSPEVNPTEHLWKHLREKYMENHFWTTLNELENALEKALLEVGRSKEIIQSLVGFHWAIL